MTVVTFVHDISKSLSTADLVVLSGILATILQYLINSFKDFAKIVNFFLSLIMPFITVLLLGLVSTGSPLAKYPVAFVVAQTLYHVTEWFKANAVQKAAEPTQF